MPQALIDDTDPGGHGSQVESYFQNDAPSGWSSDVRNKGASGIVDDAINEGAKMIVRSLIDVWDYKPEWDRAWENGIMVVHSHGSNSNTSLTDPPRLFKSAVVVGGEDPSGGYEDERSFGDGLEVDAVTHDDSTEESWATPTVGAILARLYDEHGNWWDARAILREMALRNNDENQWSSERGYGMVASPNQTESDLTVGGDAGYGYTGKDQWENRPTSPQPQPPFNVQASIIEASEGKFTFEPFKTSGWEGTRVETQYKSMITKGKEVTYINRDANGDLTFDVKSVQDGLESTPKRITADIGYIPRIEDVPKAEKAKVAPVFL